MREKSYNSNSLQISYSGMYSKDSRCILNHLPARTKSCLLCLINSEEENREKHKDIIGLVVGFLTHSLFFRLIGVIVLASLWY